jgi:hypothetical protein
MGDWTRNYPGSVGQVPWCRQRFLDPLLRWYCQECQRRSEQSNRHPARRRYCGMNGYKYTQNKISKIFLVLVGCLIWSHRIKFLLQWKESQHSHIWHSRHCLPIIIWLVLYFTCGSIYFMLICILVDDGAILDFVAENFSYPPPPGFEKIMLEQSLL